MKAKINEVKLRFIECGNCGFDRSCPHPEEIKRGRIDWFCPKCRQGWTGTIAEDGESLSVEANQAEFEEQRYVLIKLGESSEPWMLLTTRENSSTQTHYLLPLEEADEGDDNPQSGFAVFQAVAFSPAPADDAIIANDAGSHEPPAGESFRGLNHSKEPFYYRSSGSYCSLSNHEFAEELAADIFGFVGAAFTGGTLEIEIYTPPIEPPLSIEKASCGGALVLHINSAYEEKVCLIGIEFGRLDENHFPLRSAFDAELHESDPNDPFSAEIHCANFDETFRMICLLGLILQTEKTRISYGAYS